MINELFQDASDGYGTAGDGYLAPLAARTHELMAGWWAESGEGFEKVLRKYQMLLLFCDEPILDRGAEPYQSADLVIKPRNTIMHYRSETVSADVEHRLAKGLRGRFANNLLMTGSETRGGLTMLLVPGAQIGHSNPSKSWRITSATL